MKTQKFQSVMVAMVVASLTLMVSNALAQDATAQPAAVSAVAPAMTAGSAEILRLAQARVGDDTIITYIKNTGNSYSLNADQIIYLKQQGVSTAVLNVMLTQAQTAPATATASQPTAPAPQPAVATATVAPAVTYVQTVPATTYYYSNPYYYPAYYGGYYGGYGWGYPGVSLSFGWGGRWGGGGGWHGGGHGGWHR